MKIFFNAPLYSREGITHAARETAKALYNRGHHIMLCDSHYDGAYGDELALMYNAIDLRNDDYIYYKDTRPEEWTYLGGRFKNLVGFSVLEGNKIPERWVTGMNAEGVQAVCTPSTYCKEVFQRCGVTTPIHVVPHGVDGDTFRPLNDTELRSRVFQNFSGDFNNKFIFFGMGAVFGLRKKDRKGLDNLIAAFKKEFKGNDNVALLLKINTQYAEASHLQQGKKFDLLQWLVDIGLEKDDNIFVLCQDYTPEQLNELYNVVDCGTFPTRGEGYGLSGAELLAAGTPIIHTAGTGADEYAKDHPAALLISATEDELAEQRFPYFDEPTFHKLRGEHPDLNPNDLTSRWFRVDVEHLRAQMKEMYENREKYKKLALENRDEFVKKFSWENAAKKLETVFEGVMKNGN